MLERFNRADTIETPDIPDEGEHLWRWFWALSDRRQQGMNGPHPISFFDLAQWSRLSGEIALREEINILLEMDDAYRAALAEEREEQSKANEKPKKG